MAVLNAVGNNLTGQSGTGAFAGTTSPTFTSISLTGDINVLSGNAINDAAGPELLRFLSLGASAVNFLEMRNATTGSKPALIASGSDTNIILSLRGQGTGGCEIEGTSTNDNAPSGFVGQIVDSGIISGTFSSSTTIFNATSIDLDGGDWDAYASLFFIPSTFNTDNFAGGISLTSVTLPSQGASAYFRQAINGAGVTGLGEVSVTAFTYLKLSGATTVYLPSVAQWSGGSAATFKCQLWARRRR